MKRFGFHFVAMICVFAFGRIASAGAQAPAADTSAATKPAEAKPAGDTTTPKEESSVTDHTIKLGNDTIPYKATAGTILLKDDNDKPVASIF